MIPREKAEELFDKYNKAVNTYGNAPIKKCALIAVDEIIKAIDTELDPPLEIRVGIEGDTKLIGGIRYWQQVKNEIEQL